MAFTGGLLIAASVIFISCDKESSSVARNTNITCTDSAWLLADTISCSDKNYFQVLGSGKLIAVSTGNIGIDTVTRNGVFYITYDSIPGSTPCRGAIYKNATLSCWQRK